MPQPAVQCCRLLNSTLFWWSRSAVLVACATLSAFSERNGQPMLMVSGVVGGVDTRAGVHVAAVVDANGGVAFGHESFPGKGTSNVGCTVVAFWNEVFTGTWRVPLSAEMRRYCMDAPSAKKKTTTKRMNSAMPAHLNTGLHIASLAPRRPSRWIAAFRTIQVHRSDRYARLR